MMPSLIRRRSARLGAVTLLGTMIMLASAATLQAQVLSDPRIAEFDPSPDHWAVLGTGQPAVLKYELDVYLVGSSAPLGTLDMGKPSPDADGKIRYDFSAQIASLALPGSNYEARVSAVGPEGEALSDPSNPFTFTSPFSCAVFLEPGTVSAAAGGGNYGTMVSTGEGCAWSVTTSLPWVRLWTTGGTNGGPVSFEVDANTSTSGRSGNVTIGDVNLVVNQGAAAPPPCTYSLSPASASVAYSGGSASITLTTGTACGWTASSPQSWLGVSATNGTGGASITVSAAANTATSSRIGTVTVGGQTFTVTQAAAPPPPCDYSLSPGSANVPAAGGNLSFTVSADGTCSWTAAPAQAWLSVSNGIGTGTKTVTVNVAANVSSSARSGNVDVQGRVFTVNQAAAPPPSECSYSVTPAALNFETSGGTAEINVTTGEGCGWSVVPSNGWLIPSVTSGTGTRIVRIYARANFGTPDRVGTITIGTWAVTVSQDGKAHRIK